MEKKERKTTITTTTHDIRAFSEIPKYSKYKSKNNKM